MQSLGFDENDATVGDVRLSIAFAATSFETTKTALILHQTDNL